MVDTLAYRQQLRPRLPRWYRGWPHFALTNVMLGGVAALLLSRVHAPRAADLWAIAAAFGVANAVEYLLHRFPLHRPMRPLKALFKAHGIQHHRFFTGDAPEHMSTADPHDFAVVLFGPASQLTLLGGIGLPTCVLIARAFGSNAALLFGASATLYFLLYEWLHLAYHLPESHRLARLPGMRRLRLHHQRHHQLPLMSRWNFNITFPLFDVLLGTHFTPSNRDREG